MAAPMRIEESPVRGWLVPALVSAGLTVLAGCGSSRDASTFQPGGGFADSGAVGINSDGGKQDPRCPRETQYVFVIDSGGVLYKFDPANNNSFEYVGNIRCPGPVFSMAIDRKAFAYVLQDDGHMVKVDTRDASCTQTPFVAGQQGFSVNFGMGFSSNSPGSEEDTLFVSDTTAFGLGKIDTSNYALSKLGTYDAIKARAELTGTGDARLFGAFEGSPYVVAEIDKQASKIMTQAPQSAINYKPSESHFAFAFWGGDFYIFVGPENGTDVFRYSPSDNSTVKVQSAAFNVVGAGVSTCAPTSRPH
jgi:hypothetical protein